MTEVSFGEWLKRQRNSRGLTQEQLAHQIGCATITLRKIESEERRPSAQIVDQLIKIFEIPQNERNNFLKFARGDWTNAPIEKSDKTPWQVSESPRTNLPAAVTSLIGRERQLAEIHDYLLQAEIRLVTLIGPPGIGKTRLSIEAARQCLSDFADGVFFAGLATVDDPNLIAATVRQSLGYVENQKLSIEQHLMESIGEKQMLLVLDNCEYLVEDAGLFASGLLSACPNLKILATSREALHIPGEWLYTVPSLDLPKERSKADINSVSQYPALTLFAERARSARSDFALTNENIQTISAICAELDGLPLAIELIAAQMRLHSPQSLLQRLNDRFILSVKGIRAVPSRQMSLSHAVSWSFDSLTPDEQRLFAYLSVFSGGFDLSAAETIFSEQFAETTVSDNVASLLDKSLLHGSTEVNGELRFNMLAIIRHFAWERLALLSEFSKIRNWHLANFISLAERAESEIHGPQQMEWLDRLEIEHDNLRAAFGWALESQDVDASLRLANKLGFWWIIRGYITEGIDWLEKALALDPRAPSDLKANALYLLGTMLSSVNDRSDRGTILLKESLATYQKLQDKAGIASVLNILGVNAMVKENIKEAESLLNQSLQLRREVGDPWSMAHTLQNSSSLAFLQKDYHRAKDFAEETISLFKKAGDLRGVARNLSDLAELERLAGRPVQAVGFLKESLLQLLSIKDRKSIAEVMDNLAFLAGTKGNLPRTLRLYGAAETLRASIGMSIPAFDINNFESNVDTIRGSLGDDTFSMLLEEGRAMTMEQAIAYALEDEE